MLSTLNTRLLPVTLVFGVGFYLVFFQHYTIDTVQMSTQVPDTKNETDAEILKRILHGTINQSLDSGHLPLNLRKAYWSPWKDDPPESDCRNYTTRFGHNLPRVRLVSYPCSGNTWTRYLLEAATGVFTGSIYNDQTIAKAGHLGETVDPNSGLTLVQKTHGHSFPQSDISDLKQRISLITPHLPAVLLLRNPARTIISHWKYKESGSSHLKQLPDKLFKTTDFHKFAADCVSKWEILALDRLLWSEAPVFVLHYEHLLANPLPTLRTLLAFLGAPVDEGRLACVSTHLTGSFKRQGNKDFDPFTNDEKKLMAVAASRVNRTLQLLGYQPLPYHTII